MSFGEDTGAISYLIGKPVTVSLVCLHMNHARLEVGLKVALGERSYQDALAYAKDRVQGRNSETGEPARIIEHADVQRMLMQMRSMTDAMRGLTYDGAYAHDFRVNGSSEEERILREQVCFAYSSGKAWCTELVNEVTSLGSRFTEEWASSKKLVLSALQRYQNCRDL